MNKNQAICYVRDVVGKDRKVTVVNEFKAENLPAVIRLHGKDGYIDVPQKDFKKKVLGLKGKEVFTIGRLPLCDLQADHYEDSLISRVHVIWQKSGDKFLLINCGIFGTTAFAETADGGLQEIPTKGEPWADYEE